MLPLYQGLTAQTYSTIKSRSCCCVGEAEAAAMLSALGAASTMFTACCGCMTFGQSLRHVNNLCTTVTTHGCNNPTFSFVNCFRANSPDVPKPCYHRSYTLSQLQCDHYFSIANIECWCRSADDAEDYKCNKCCMTANRATRHSSSAYS